MVDDLRAQARKSREMWLYDVRALAKIFLTKLECRGEGVSGLGGCDDIRFPFKIFSIL